jgi:uridine kinase
MSPVTINLGSARFANLVRTIQAATAPTGMPTRIIAIDGHGGSGKSRLPRELAAALGGIPIVATDDFASWDNPVEWWPRLVEQVLRPLALGEVVRYQRYDWSDQRLADWIELPRCPPTIVLEGVTASRSEFDSHLAFRIWVEAPRELRLRRGLERDGDAMRAQWDAWMATEDAYVARDDPVGRADVVVSGTG